ncbi:uncharacterized protein [Rutidosis leptorrhynchoides]|uniref:uncharacterized protein n=1 Tax=Rutidosis leptorrhynchoides TaxID=125765 RepID=UPI003A994745
MDQFELYFKRADLDQDGRVSGPEAVSFFQASGLPKPVLAQIWTFADQNRIGYLGRAEFYNYLKLVTVAQSKRDLTPDMVKAALYGRASAKIPPPKINLEALPAPRSNLNVGPPTQYPQTGSIAPPVSQGPQGYTPQQGQVTRPPSNTTFQLQPGPNHVTPGGGMSRPPGSTSSAPGVPSQPPSKGINPSMPMDVDTDRDGKVTGEQARNLFLSWKLPREILKQVWDLSDQDNDSMQPLHPDSLIKFSKIAFQCLQEYPESRPLMSHVVRELEAALEMQEHQYLKLQKEYEEIKYESIEDSQEHRLINTYSGISIQGSLTSSYKSFTLEEVTRATDGFSDKKLLGEGAFGKVFHGHISGNGYDGLVAVKRLKECSKQGQDEFQKEIELLSTCNHPNIISLIGCCDQGSEKILVYDFMKKGSLYDCLYREKEKTPRLSVEQRLEICIGVAKGLNYLHSGRQNNIIHSDLKTDNILLDADLVPKISDFGLSRTRAVGPSSSDVVTNTTKGTEGYIAPECYEPNYKVSRKADVYAFGVVFLEVLCERAPWERLLMLALPNILRREFPETAPESVKRNISPRCSQVCIYIIKDCLDNDPRKRPTIDLVVDNLESALKLQKQERQANS